MFHIEFCLKLFKLQRARGAYFLMEHPAYADSWKLDCVEDFRKSEGVMTSVADQCMYGLVTPGPLPEKALMAAKKPTQFMSNSWCILHELATRCDKSHVHQELMGGRASKAAEYPDELCRAICRGLANQKRYDLSGKVCTGSLDSLSLMSLLEPIDSQFPAHWIDSKHEPEGTAHEFLATDTAVEEEALGAFKVGHNDGADLLKIE